MYILARDMLKWGCNKFVFLTSMYVHEIRPLHDLYRYDDIKAELIIPLAYHAQGHSNVANRQ